MVLFVITMSVITAESVADPSPGELVGLFTYVMSYDRLAEERTCVVASLSVSARHVAFGRELCATPDTQLVELPDAHASRDHAIAHREGAIDWIENRSPKGTYLDGVRVEGVVALEDGARIDMGHSLLCYRRVTPDIAARLKSQAVERTVGLTPTCSPRALRLLDDIELFAQSRTPLLVLGPRGSGKEHVAMQIHQTSRRVGPFVSVDCGAIHEGIFAPEFFGVAKRGVQQLDARQGFLRSANGGTLFLDEFGNLAIESQLRLLRAFQNKRVRPVGSDSEVDVDVRLVAATNKDIFDPKLFPSDLVDRLAGYVLFVPPLRERIEDLGTLVAFGLREQGLTGVSIKAAAARRLFGASFPGNIRQLNHVVAALARIARGGAVTETHLQESSIRTLLREATELPVAAMTRTPEVVHREPPACEANGPARPPRTTDPGRERILQALERAGNTLRAAELLGVPERSLRRWMERHGIP